MSLGKNALYSCVNWVIVIDVHCAAHLLCGFHRGVLGPATAQAFTSFRAFTKLLLVWLREAKLIYHTLS